MVQVLKEQNEQSQTTIKCGQNDTTDTSRKNSYAEEAYKNITSSMQADPLKIENPIVALNLFSTAIKVQNLPLAKQCIEILDNHLDKNNVLCILSHMTKCRTPNLHIPNDYQPSAPPIVENDNQRTEDWVHQLIDELSENCLCEIDKHADFILKQKEILQLSYPDILNITTRDTLQVTNELFVYSCVMRWCIEECKRRTLQIQLINIKAVLRELAHAPRYGLMSKKDFQCRTVDGVKGPARSGILDDSEIERILKYLKKIKNRSSIEELPYKASQPRMMLGKNSRQCTERSCCDKWLINFLTCWTAVFD